MGMITGLRPGGAEVQDPEELLESAAELVKGADTVFVVLGLWCEHCHHALGRFSSRYCPRMVSW